jgi:hypothetical protein
MLRVAGDDGSLALSDCTGRVFGTDGFGTDDAGRSSETAAGVNPVQPPRASISAATTQAAALVLAMSQDRHAGPCTHRQPVCAHRQ